MTPSAQGESPVEQALVGGHPQRVGGFKFYFDTERWEFTENRSHIEQAKGMLIIIYGVNDNAAFDLLRWRSQANNVKLRALAAQIVEDFGNFARTQRLPEQRQYDHLFLTAHQRAAS